MTVPLLRTKLYTPSLQREIVPRPHLIERLNAGIGRDRDFVRKLTLISAPAGFGKTTLLSEWVSQVQHPIAWITLDAGDNAPDRFWAYVVAALQTAGAEVGDIQPATLQSSHPPSIDSLLTPLLNQLTEVSEPLVLVLDDYHVIDAQSIHAGLAFLLDNLPPQIHLVIATRADPPLPIARLRGRGQLTELYQADLRFASDEAAAFLNQVMGLDLSSDDVAALEARTEGWIAGLQLAAVSMRGRDDVTGFVRVFTGSHRYILDYLGSEVLRQQSESVRRFLLQTSILARLTAPLCDAVIDGDLLDGPPESAQAMLEYLENNNLFVVPLDDERRWYRYHHLFAELLQQRIGREQPDLVRDLHRRASAWYEKQGLIDEAVRHALATGDHDRAADMIEQAGWSTFTRGEMSTIRRWINALPKALISSHPYLGVLHAWATAKSGYLEGVEPCLQDIDPHKFRGEIAAVRAYVAGVQGDLTQAVDLAQQALDHLPEQRLLLRAIVVQNLGVTYHWNGDSAAAIRNLTEARRLSEAAEQPFQTLTAMAILGRAYEMQGSLRQAAAIYQEALALTSNVDSQPVPFACMAHVGMAGCLYKTNDLERAIHHATEGIRLSKIGGFIAYQIFGYVRLSQIHESQGHRETALEALQEAEHLSQRADYALVVALATELRMRMWIAQENLTAASRWAAANRLRMVEHPDAAQEIEQRAVVRVLLAQGKTDEALRLLSWLLKTAQAGERHGSSIKLLTLQALAYQAQSKVPKAFGTLAQVLALAEPEGYVRTFLDEGEPMNELLRQALSEDIAPNYVARLLAAFDEEPEAITIAMNALVEPLSDRELEVLRLIVAGLSNPEIAEELFIAVSTVKSHVNNIYGKLAVENRIQATARAQNLGLV